MTIKNNKKTTTKKKQVPVKSKSKPVQGKRFGGLKRVPGLKEKNQDSDKIKPAEKTVKSQNISELVIEKRKLSQENTKWLKVDAAISVVVCIALLFLSIGVVSSKKSEVFFLVNAQNQFKEITPLYMPKHSNGFVGDWLNKCLIDTFDFSYVNYQKRLGEVSNECYSPEGKKSLENALINTGNLEAVKSKKLYVSMSLNYSPVVVREMKPNSASEPYRWVLQSEGTINLQSQTSNDPNDVKVTVVVSRSSMETSGKGLAIDRIIIN